MPAADPVAQRVASFYKYSSALPTAVIAAGEHEFMNGTARRPAVVFSLAGPIGRGGRLGPVLGLLSRHSAVSTGVPSASVAGCPA